MFSRTLFPLIVCDVVDSICNFGYNLNMILISFVCLFNNSSQMIGPKRLKFSVVDGGNPGVVIRKFGED